MSGLSEGVKTRRILFAILMIICALALTVSCAKRESSVRISSKSSEATETDGLSTTGPQYADTAYVYFSDAGTIYHLYPDCSGIKRISAEHLKEGRVSLTQLADAGYSLCKTCAARLEAESEADAEAGRSENEPIESFAVEAAETTADTAVETTAVQIVATETEPETTAAETTKYETKEAEPQTKATETEPPKPTIAAGSVWALINQSSGVAHICQSCPYAAKMSAENRLEVYAQSIGAIETAGYRICSYCLKHYGDSQTEAEVTTAKPETTTARTTETQAPEQPDSEKLIEVIVNTSTRTFHIDPECRHVKSMKPENRAVMYVSDPNVLIEQGYKPCGTCSAAYKQ